MTTPTRFVLQNHVVLEAFILIAGGLLVSGCEMPSTLTVGNSAVTVHESQLEPPPEPSASPSDAPMIFPSAEPTEIPSIVPSVSPVVAPTPSPTAPSPDP